MDLPISDVRLAASAGLAARYLARPDARRVGLIGSGMISLPMLQGLCGVRSIEAVDVYSPTPEHRAAFAERAGRELGIPVTAHDAPEPVIDGADILAVATNILHFGGEYSTGALGSGAITLFFAIGNNSATPVALLKNGTVITGLIIENKPPKMVFVDSNGQKTEVPSPGS